MREPVPGVLLQTDGGWVLLDTGFNTALIRDPALYRRFFPTVEYSPVLPGPGEPIEESLHDIGVDIDDIHAVAVSHLHHDHAGGLKLFAGKVPVHAQRREARVRAVESSGARAQCDRADRLRRSAHRLAAGRRRGRDRAGHHRRADLRAHPWPSEFRGRTRRIGRAATGSCSRSTPPISPRTSSTSWRSADSSASTPEETVEPIRRLKKLAQREGLSVDSRATIRTCGRS